MNGRLELRIITQPYSEVYWGFLRRLVFGNSLTKHNKFSSFSYSVVIFFSRFPTYRLVFMLTLPISHVWLGPVDIVSKKLIPRGLWRDTGISIRLIQHGDFDTPYNTGISIALQHGDFDTPYTTRGFR